jgi:type IV pilus assembly protein PilC
MPTFQYTAKTQAGQIKTGTAEAEDEKILRQRLQHQGFFPTEVKVVSGRAAAKIKAKQDTRSVKETKKNRFVFGKVKLRDLSLFCRQFSTMMNAGVSLIRCLTVLEQQTSSYKLKEIIRDLQAQVEAGESLSKAMMRHPKAFSNLFIGLVRAGEVGGVMDETLDRLAGFLEKDMELKRKIKSAMTYPVLVLVVAFGIVTFLMTFILPKFIQLFVDLGVKDFPAPTLFLKNVSEFMVTWMFKKPIAWFFFAGFIWAYRQWYKTKSGRRIVDYCKLKVPVFGQLTLKICLSRFARTLSTMLGSGVPVLGALETTAGTIDNHIIQTAVMNARAAIREGEVICKPLEQSGWFPPMIVQMVSIGEETGALDAMLEKVAEFYESEVEAALESLTAALEPIMIVILGCIVGFIVIAMFLPLVAIIDSLSQ